MSEWVLDLKGVRKVYRGGVEALRGVDLQVPRGTIFGLLGPNGAGKSTLVKILTTIIRPTACEGTFLGEAVGHKPTLKRVGYLPEHARFPEYLTAREVVHMAAGLSGMQPAVTRGRANALLERVGLGDWQNKKVGGFSKGMKQRVGIAQALINDPEVIFLDEPTDGVDPAGRRDFRLLLEELRKEGKTVFVNSHLLGELEMVCDRVAILSKGEIKLEGALKDLTGRQVEYRISCGKIDSVFKQSFVNDGTRWEAGDLVVATAAAEEVMPLLDQLRAGGVVIEGLVRKSASLEDVFMEAVGTDTPGAAPKAARSPQPPALK
ncbi:ABC transporter ATP-binding protein [Roseibacillus persicicus]|uniref:ABC transporter ATP-binding protein n=1 Tax=Roseibacillus persicicus TaxID=454148 RepID=UPI00280D3DB3|nr:ABC transporter ATP-binding protein [Roseibacillus persicicus]MDQ8189692.1 ABC transporter ATP-binding protein [Roseibacillus persicicus]